MEIQIKIDATPAAVTCAESLGLLGAGLKALTKLQTKPQSCTAAPTPPVEEPAPEPAPSAEEPAPEPARQVAEDRREARQNSGDAHAPQGGAATAPQGGAADSPAELHTHADILTICAALKRDYPEDFTPAAGLQFTRDACKAAGVESIKPTDPEAVERLYQAVAKMAANFRALQGGAANG